jgi:hypothetical protein
MAAAGVDERWCLGDLVGGEPVTAELVGAARQLDLLIAGNHDAWTLGPDRLVARGRDVFRLSSRAKASRHGIDCWHGSPRHPLLGFLTEASAGKILPERPVGSLGLVGHTHEPAPIPTTTSRCERLGTVGSSPSVAPPSLLDDPRRTDRSRPLHPEYPRPVITEARFLDRWLDDASIRSSGRVMLDAASTTRPRSLQPAGAPHDGAAPWIADALIGPTRARLDESHA